MTNYLNSDTAKIGGFGGCHNPLFRVYYVEYLTICSYFPFFETVFSQVRLSGLNCLTTLAGLPAQTE